MDEVAVLTNGLEYVVIDVRIESVTATSTTLHIYFILTVPHRSSALLLLTTTPVDILGLSPEIRVGTLFNGHARHLSYRRLC